MILRPDWQERIESAWRERRVVWLAGPRRLGKTTLARSLANIEYFDCDLPRVRRDADDTEAFLAAHRGKRLVVDEIHRLSNPSELLKVASDHFPDIHILATGSSTLGAGARFRDTLAGRKRTVHLRPVLCRELPVFGSEQRDRRMLHGGLPENLLRGKLDDAEFVDWREAFWARDILELFSVAKRYSFLRFLEMLWAQSGGLCQLTSFTGPCEASRQTLANYLDILAATGVVTVLRPFATHPQRELVAMPKVYAFDTGFVCHARGWSELRPEDRGNLWEHLVLDELLFCLADAPLHYWRDKQKHEVDFVWKTRGRAPVAIECKWKSSQWDEAACTVFRALHPGAACWVIAADRESIIERRSRTGTVLEAGISNLPELVAGHRGKEEV
ncbi:MAG: DUF4143 domain-containing protein [Terrimicrobiaceae bacterium]|nr:AAA family ATPase [Terrimicrobiaceae bacterium]